MPKRYFVRRTTDTKQKQTRVYRSLFSLLRSTAISTLTPSTTSIIVTDEFGYIMANQFIYQMRNQYRQQLRKHLLTQMRQPNSLAGLDCRLRCSARFFHKLFPFDHDQPDKKHHCLKVDHGAHSITEIRALQYNEFEYKGTILSVKVRQKRVGKLKEKIIEHYYDNDYSAYSKSWKDQSKSKHQWGKR